MELQEVLQYQYLHRFRTSINKLASNHDNGMKIVEWTERPIGKGKKSWLLAIIGTRGRGRIFETEQQK